MGASFRALGFLLRGTTVLWEFGGCGSCLPLETRHFGAYLSVSLHILLDKII